MIDVLSSSKDDRITAILGNALADYWLNILIKNKFHNSKEISQFDFDKKRKILYGLQLLKSTTNNDLNRLNDIRNEYAHNFFVKDNKILTHLKKMNCYKQMKFGKNSKNNDKIKKCTRKLVSDLMDIEEKIIRQNEMSKNT